MRTLAAAAQNQAEIAKAASRPYVFIQFTGFELNKLIDWSLGKEHLRMPFRLKNYGTVPAIIDDAICDEISSVSQPDIGVLRQRSIYAGSPQVLPAGAASQEYRCSNPGVTAAFEQGRDRDREIFSGLLWFLGKVKYRDIADVPYYTSICVQMLQINWPPREGGGAGCNERK